MKLEYSRPYNSMGNFGDDLNEWFWERILPGMIDEDASVILLGMGTIFDNWFTKNLPTDSLKVVIGSGGGKLGGPPALDKNWRVYGVRGPLTAAYSNLGSEAVLTDPAVLLREMEDLRPSGPRRGIGFMPHIWSMDRWDWRSICSQLGLVYIDPRADAKDTIRQIWSLERIITEAMHGAIVGDALRTPWIPVSISSQFEASKWYDWAGSLGMPLHFHVLPDLYGPRYSDPMSVVKAGAKSLLALTDKGLQAGYRWKSRSWEVRSAKVRLRNLMADAEPQLSNGECLDAAVARIKAALDRLKHDYEMGRLIAAA